MSKTTLPQNFWKGFEPLKTLFLIQIRLKKNYPKTFGFGLDPPPSGQCSKVSQCRMSCVTKNIPDKMVKLVYEGSVIKGATVSSLLPSTAPGTRNKRHKLMLLLESWGPFVAVRNYQQHCIMQFTLHKVQEASVAGEVPALFCEVYSGEACTGEHWEGAACAHCHCGRSDHVIAHTK